MAERWDREWINYFRRAPEYFEDYSSPNAESDRRAELVRRAAMDANGDTSALIDERNPVWKLWAIGCLPAEIVDRSVADLGCGAGGIGRTLGYVVQRYVGVDYSPLALRVASLVSPPQCTFVVRTDPGALDQFAGSIDTAFSRSVFIHQNYPQAVDLASLAAGLLKPGGLLAVDFHRPEVDENGAFTKPPRPARGELERDAPSVGFYFTDAEIAEVGTAAGLTLESITDVPERNWRIARFRR